MILLYLLSLRTNKNLKLAGVIDGLEEDCLRLEIALDEAVLGKLSALEIRLAENRLKLKTKELNRARQAAGLVSLPPRVEDWTSASAFILSNVTQARNATAPSATSALKFATTTSTPSLPAPFHQPQRLDHDTIAGAPSMPPRSRHPTSSYAPTPTPFERIHGHGTQLRMYTCGRRQV